MRYVILENNIVQNIIEINESTFDESVLNFFYDGKTIIKENWTETKRAYIGGDLYKKKFRMPKPHPSWEWSEELELWNAPINYPNDGNTYIWNENLIKWLIYSPN